MNLTKIIKREILITSLTIIGVAITFFGLAYALYFKVDEENIGTVSFGQLTFDMCADEACNTGGTTYGTIITASVYPMNTTEGTSQTPYLFKVSNNGSTSMSVKVYVARDNNVSNYQNVVVASKVQGTSTYSYTDLTSANTAVVLDTTLSAGQNKIIELYMWVNEEAENDIMDESISLFVNAVGYYKPSDSSNLHTTDSYVANVAGPELNGKVYEYTGDYQEFEVQLPGYYYIQAYGAQGGGYDVYVGGKGAYTSGYIYLTSGEKLYVYVGEAGKSNQYENNAGGWNGGGSAIHDLYDVATVDVFGGGGGASDIRYFGNTTPSASDLEWDSTLGLNSRIMVAAGGGGAYVYNLDNTYSFHLNGGAGGTLIGNNGNVYLGAYNVSSSPATGGTQTSGGKGNNADISGNDGAFGVGGNGFQNSGEGSATGGGAGYYGGGGTHNLGNSAESAAGGSSFISGYAGVNAITSASSRVHTNNTLHYSEKYFLLGSMRGDVNSNNGSVIITYKGLIPRVNEKLDGVRYIKDCINGNSIDSENSWYEIQAIKDGINIAKNKTVTGTVSQYDSTYNYNLAVNGIISETPYAKAGETGTACITVDLGNQYDLDEIVVWHNVDGRVFNDNVTSVSSDNSTWTNIIESGITETLSGNRVNAFE